MLYWNSEIYSAFYSLVARLILECMILLVCLCSLSFQSWQIIKKTELEPTVSYRKVQLSLSMPWRQTVGVEVHLHSLSTLELDKGKWSTSCPGCFMPRQKTWYPLNLSLGGSWRWSGHSGEKDISCPWWDLNPWSSSPQPSLYTYYAILASQHHIV